MPAMADWQLTIDCHSPSRLVGFWAEVLGYEVMEPPSGFDTWNDWYLSVGVPADELDLDSDSADRIADPTGNGPSIWFQSVPENKTVKNRLHLDISVGGGRDNPIEERRRRVDARVAELVELGASVDHAAKGEKHEDHYFVVMRDPEGNEFCVA